MWRFRRGMTESSASGSAVVQRAALTEWRSTPPMPIVQATSFTTLDTGFEQRLATRGRPLFLEPLGHQLRPDAPSGIVTGLAEPAPHGAPARAVQRSFAPALGSVATRMTNTEPVPPVPTIDVGVPSDARDITPNVRDITPNVRDITPNVRAGPARRLVEATPPALASVQVPVVARTPADGEPASPSGEHDADADADADANADAPTASMVPLVAQRSVLDEPRPTLPPVPGVTGPADGPRLSPGAVVERSRASHSLPPAVRIGEAIPSHPVAQRAVETSRPASAGPAGSIDSMGAQPPFTPTDSSPSTHATSPMVSVRPAIGGDPSTGMTTSEATQQDDVATVDLPLVGRQLVGSTPVAADTSPVGPLPAVTTPAARGFPTRRATIGEPLSGGSPGPVVQAAIGEPLSGDSPGPVVQAAIGEPLSGDSPGPVVQATIGEPLSGDSPGPVVQATIGPDSSAAPIDRVTIPTLGETPPLLGPVQAAPATAGPASPSVERITPGRGHSALPDVSGVASVATSVQRAPASQASAGVGATVTVPAGTRPVITPTNVVPDVSAIGPLGAAPRPVVARRLATTTEPVTAGRPLDTANTLRGPRPNGHGDDATSTLVVELLAARPLPTTLDGPGARPDASSWSREPATSDRASSPAGSHRAPDSRGTVQRAVGAMRAPGVVPQAAAGSQPAVPPATHRPTGFVALDDGTVVEWAHDAPAPEMPAAVQRQTAPDPGPARDAEAATGGNEATTTTAVATVGPAAPAAPAAPRSEAELQELCRALYVPLRRRLCRDLLLDRERAGYRTDIRF